MIRLNLDELRRFSISHYMPIVQKELGKSGVFALRQIMEKLHNLYSFLEPETIKGTMIIIKSIDKEETPGYFNAPEHFSNIEYLAQDFFNSNISGISVIQILNNGEFYFWKNVLVDPLILSDDYLVYVYSNRNEQFIVKRNKGEIPKFSNVYASVYSIPTFRNLIEALEHYRLNSIRTSCCYIFSNCWYGGRQSNRLFFRSSPEELMRDSLTQFLRNVLFEAEVRPEQNVDESHPVDIRISWSNNRQAIIEIKWLGKSKNNSGKINKTYTDFRAKQGAKRLAYYLDRNLMQVPNYQTKGYLIVIDARRWRLNESSTSVNNKNGMYYQDREIKYDPEYHKQRDDFEEPIRMFARPVCIPN